MTADNGMLGSDWEFSPITGFYHGGAGGSKQGIRALTSILRGDRERAIMYRPGQRSATPAFHENPHARQVILTSPNALAGSPAGPARTGRSSRLRPPPAKALPPDRRAPVLPTAYPAPEVATAPTPSTRRRSPATAPGVRRATAPAPARRRSDRHSVAGRTTTVTAAASRKGFAPTVPSRFVRFVSTRPGKRPPAAAIPAPCAPTRPAPNTSAAVHPSIAHNAAKTSAIPRFSIS